MRKMYSKILFAVSMMMMASSAFAEEVTFKFTYQDNGIVITKAGAGEPGGDVEASLDGVVITSAGGQLPEGKALQIYKTKSMTITVPEGNVITSVDFTYATSCYPFAEAIPDGLDTATKTSSGKQTAIFTATTASRTATFTNVSGGQTKVNRMVVTFEPGEEGDVIGGGEDIGGGDSGEDNPVVDGPSTDGNWVITFAVANTDKDSGDSWTTESDLTDVFATGAEYVSQITSIDKVYPARNSLVYGAKFGTSSVAGAISFNLVNTVEASEIIVSAAPYGDAEGHEGFTCNGVNVSMEGGKNKVYADYHVTLTNKNLSAVTLSQNKAAKGRIYVQSITIVPVNDPTAITNVNNANNSTPVVYNLAGQQVDASTKGIVIVNGKKVLNK